MSGGKLYIANGDDGTKYYPPIDSCSYDEHELDMYFIGDNYGKDED